MFIKPGTLVSGESTLLNTAEYFQCYRGCVRAPQAQMTAPSVSQDSLSPRHPVLAAVAQEDSFGDLFVSLLYMVDIGTCSAYSSAAPLSWCHPHHLARDVFPAGLAPVEASPASSPLIHPLTLQTFIGYLLCLVTTLSTEFTTTNRSLPSLQLQVRRGDRKGSLQCLVINYSNGVKAGSWGTCWKSLGRAKNAFWRGNFQAKIRRRENSLALEERGVHFRHMGERRHLQRSRGRKSKSGSMGLELGGCAERSQKWCQVTGMVSCD